MLIFTFRQSLSSGDTISSCWLSRSLDNAIEREIRKAKIKMKVSQCFRSFKGAEAFDVLHSLMDTAKKNGQSAFNVIRTIAYPMAMVDDAFLTL